MTMYIGTFNEQEVKNKIDRKTVEEKQVKYPHLKYVKTEMIKQKGVIVGMKVFLTDNF